MNKTKRTTESQSGRKAQPAAAEPREAALTQAEHDTAGFQKKASKLGAEKLTPDEQRRRFIEAAREAGASEDESDFDAAVKKVAVRSSIT